MRSTNQSYSVLTPGVTGGDVVKTGTLLNVSNCTPVFPPIDVRFLTDPLIVKYDPVAETLAVWDITPPATPTSTAGANNYGYTINQVIPFVSPTPALPGVSATAGTNNVSYDVNSAASAADSKVTLMQHMQSGLRNYVNSASNLQVTSAVNGTTGVQTITAKAGYPLVNLVDISQATAPFVSMVNTTPGVASVGTYNDLLRYGVNAAHITSGHTYGFVILNYQALIASGGKTVNLTWTHTLYVDRTSVTNYNNFWTALKTAVGTIFP